VLRQDKLCLQSATGCWQEADSNFILTQAVKEDWLIDVSLMLVT
jgi:hypothetical protein